MQEFDSNPRVVPANEPDSAADVSRQATIRDLDALERYIDDYLASIGSTFEEWMERFGQGAYALRNQSILNLMAPHRPRRILEFACAGGFLAKLLLDRVPTIERYYCTNFSVRLVEYCRSQLSGYPQCSVGLVNADVAVSDDMAQANLEQYDTFLTTSFEHIEHDLELIRALPSGRCFVFGVAGFDDPEHFRVFENVGQIRQRYEAVLTIEHIETLEDHGVRKFVTVAWTK